jgi:hypothetical protein
MELAKQILLTYGENGIIGVLILVALALIMNAQKIITFLDSNKKRRVNLLSEIASNDLVDDSIKAHIKNEINSEYFKIAHGVYLDKNKIITIIETHKKLNNIVPFRAFINANRLILAENDSFSLNIKTKDKVSYILNNIISFLLFTISPFLVALAGVNMTIYNEVSSSLALLGLALFSITVSIFVLSSSRDYSSAKLIEGELIKNAKNGSN